jgi:hypothetical protein
MKWQWQDYAMGFGFALAWGGLCAIFGAAIYSFITDIWPRLHGVEAVLACAVASAFVGLAFVAVAMESLRGNNSIPPPPPIPEWLKSKQGEKP